MARFYKKRSALLGKRPEEFIYVGEISKRETRLKEILYNSEKYSEKEGISILKEPSQDHEEGKSWLNVDGIHDETLMKRIKELYAVPAINIADIMNTGLRPKFESTEWGCIVVIKMLRYDDQKSAVFSEQISMVKQENRLLTFQEFPGDVFDPVRERLSDKVGRVRKESIEFLVYSLLDCIVDNYVNILQILAEKIEDVEETLMDNPDEMIHERIVNLKKELLYFGKSVRPGRDVIRELIKSESSLNRKHYKSFYNDLLSNIVQVTEAIDLYKEMLTEQLNSYNTIVNNRLNEIMKFLTIFSVIFLPLTLVTGIYGTNFTFIPELQLRFGYALLWGVLLILAGLMILVFKKKKWF